MVQHSVGLGRVGGVVGKERCHRHVLYVHVEVSHWTPLICTVNIC